ncbi:MAG: HAMP domain-containing histidine kinase [Clostridiales bacterium]|nr:HAMP domain-containing histidine kinase [Clostridiales bacterium]
MDTKSKKSNKFVYKSVFLLCVVSFMATVLGIVFSVFLVNSNGLIRGDFWALYFPNDYHSTYLAQVWAKNEAELILFRNQISLNLGIALLCAAVAAVSFVYLCTAVGDRDEDGKVILKGVDRVYTEIQLCVIAAMLAAGGSLFVKLTLLALHDASPANGLLREGGFAINLYEPSVIAVILACVTGTISAYAGLWMCMSCIRKIKARRFVKQSMIGKVFMSLFETLYSGGSLMRKIMLVAILACLLSATIVLLPVVLVLVFVFMPKRVRKYEEIKNGVNEVRGGNLEYKIPVTGKSELDRLGAGINDISQSSKTAVQNEMKNQRMKAELISNVSHDLKTPLTSIVTYIDLLKTEGLSSENATEYLDVLDQKTGRLKQLTEDLFEAAKASSGAMPVKREKVDMLSLINQGLGEMDQKIKASGLEVIVKAELEKHCVWADGQLLWRVFENLLGNVLKYAQANTRVYIDMSEQGAADNPKLVVMDIKNISRQALNIEANELLERFKRGDESRATEGSGLGLAIAKDLVKLQNGWLDIKIDGDLFKATVMLEKAG